LRAPKKQVRILGTTAYFVLCFGGLFYYTYRSFFCSGPGGSAHLAQTLRLSIAFTAWESLAGACGALVARSTARRWLWPPVSASIALLGFASTPFWIYQGFGTFLFEGTWADVSCFFTEGYGFMFPFVVAPALALATYLVEWAVMKTTGCGQSSLNAAM